MKMTLDLCVKSTVDLQKYRLLFLASQFQNGFYQNRGFLLDIGGEIKRKDISVFLESEIANFLRGELDWNRINFTKIEDIWNSNLDDFIPNKYNHLFVSEVKNNHKLVNQWYEYDERVLDLIKHFGCLYDKYNITVVFTPNGTLSSFHPVSYPEKLFVYIREDAEFNSLVYGIVNLLIQSVPNYGDYEERQKVIRFIYNMPLFKEMLGDAYLSNERIKRTSIPEKDLQTSRANYQYIGFPIKDSLFVINGNIYINETEQLRDLSIAETKLLIHFINNKGKIISYDTISDILWEGEFYSLQAITKQMQRLKYKLGKYYKRQPIITVRKKGYIYNF